MGNRETFQPDAPADAEDLLAPLMQAPLAAATAATMPGITIGELIAIADEGTAPLVTYPGQQGTAVLRAATLVDLHAAHINRRVALMFEAGDPARPIVVGVLREGAGWPLAERPAQVEVRADGERLIVSAREQLVLKCGKASITLTRAGKVLIEGSYLSSRSTGVNRIKGGSVQLN